MVSSMEKDEHFLAGVSVACEGPLPRSSSTSNADNCLISTVLGIVKISSTSMTASQLKDVLRRDLPALPTDFLFLTKQGWPVTREQENEIKVVDLLGPKSLITVRRHFGTPRLGVRNLSNEVLGFIFIDYNSTALDLRQSIKEQLTFLTTDLVFFDGRGWPVHTSQEKDLLIWDLVCDGYITMRSTIAESVSNFAHSCSDTPDGHGKRRKHNEWNGGSHLSVESKSLTDQGNGELPNVLISYVRAEAARHARDLKWQLKDKGYKVFLDVDEIRGGSDWQDALNDAVLNCTLFIPLITPQYGQTIWTNREVKLADQLKKQIIPINFLDSWPPPCLAIQFASLHFLPWKTNAEIEEEKLDYPDEQPNSDIRFWSTEHIRRVVESITECYHQEIQYFQEGQDLSQKSEDDSSCTIKTGKLTQEMATTPLNDVEFDRPIEPKPLVVLSAHPSDEESINTIRAVLSSVNYDVWSSSDNPDEFESLSQTSRLASPMTPLPPTFFDSGPLLFNNSNSQESTCSETFYHSGPKRRPSLLFSCSVDSKGPSLFRSDSQQTLSPVSMDKLRIFRNRADKAVAVIVLLSEEYCRAKTSEKQVFYCEHRKPVIPIMISNFRLPTYITNLFGNDIIKYKNSQDFFEDLKRQIQVKIDTDTPKKSKICISEILLQSKVQELKEKINNQNCIYVIGSTRTYNARTENICIAIGQDLAACEFIALATSGFYGAGAYVGRSFCEEQDVRGQKPALLFNILPVRDSKDLSKVSRQAPDGIFQKVPYGQTIFIGDSVCERDNIVARAFNVCLLIEGDSECAREAERFLWNDNIVIPVICTGGAAAGEKGSRIWDIPPGVSESDWKILSKKDEPVEVIAAAIKRILCSLKSKEANTGKPHSKRASRRSTKASHR